MAKKLTPFQSNSNLEKVNNHLGILERQLKKQNSLRLSFLRGLMAGLGATVGLAIVITFLVFVINSVANLLGQQSVGDSVIEILQ